MRNSLAYVLVTLTACGGSSPVAHEAPDSGVDVDGGSLVPPARGFQIVSPDIAINPGVEVTYCYFFHASNTTDLAIKKWASHMTPGSHHMILYLTPTDMQTPGTMSTSQCGVTKNGLTTPVWTYSAQEADAESVLPANDGHGVPVGQLVTAGQSGFLQMHYLNATDAVIHAHVELNAYAYDDGAQVTPAAPFVTYNTKINLPPGSATAPSSDTVSGNCTITPDLKFYVMTTHTHKQGVHTSVKDGATVVFDSTDWEHPGSATWNKTPFYSFTSGKLTYQCDYRNPNNRTITTGDSAATDEMCMAVGYYFPTPTGSGHLCLDSNMLN